MTSKRNTIFNFKKKSHMLKITLSLITIPALACIIPMEFCFSEWETRPK